MANAYLEVDGVAVFEARLHLGDSVFRVPVEDVKMGDAFTGEKWSRHGAVEPDNASKKIGFSFKRQRSLPHVAWRRQTSVKKWSRLR